MRKIVLLISLALLSGIVSGCGLRSGGGAQVSPVSVGAPPVASVSGVPFFPQQEYECGPASLAMVLSWSGVSIAPQPSAAFDALVTSVYSPEKQGSLQPSMVAAVRRNGRIAYPLKGHEALYQAVAEGVPVVVFLNLGLSWVPQWHYAVVTGYDAVKEEISLYSGTDADKRMSFTLFNNVWQRGEYWGLVALPAGKIPAFAAQETWLEAVTGLERAEQWEAALAAYSAATNRWHRSYEAWLGTGNVQYQLGRLRQSENAFRRATMIQPDNGIAYNNLASVLSELGRREEAIAAATKAVQCGGSLVEVFRSTLTEVSAP